MYRLYDYLPSGNCYKVRLLLTQLGLPFERINIDILKGESRTPEFLAKNPNGRTPTIELSDGRYLSESNAIIWYLANGTPFLPNDEFQRAQVLQWMFFEQYSHEPNIATSRFWISIQGKREQFQEALKQKQVAGYAALDVMELHLKDKSFFVGNQYSIADIALYAYTHVANEGDFSLESYPAIRQWLDRVAGQPNYIPISDKCQPGPH